MGAELKSNSMLHIWKRFKRVSIDIFIGFTHLEKMTFGPTTSTPRVFCMCTIFKTIFQSNKDAIWLKEFIYLSLEAKGKNNKEPIKTPYTSRP